ncbi:DUF559 domain-containing protein [soil metagenome]
MTSFDPRRPFTRAEGIRAGLTWRDLSGPGFRRLFHGVYVSARITPHQDLLLEAARKVVGQEAVASHHTATRIWGGIAPHTPDVHFTVSPKNVRSRSQGIRTHSGTPPTVARQSALVTSPTSTFLDMARCSDLVDLVVLGDSLIKAKVTTASDLEHAAASARGAGTHQATRAAGYLRAGVDSAMESRSRMLLCLAGLPQPVVNFEVRDSSGVVTRRLDMCYPAYKLAIEYDGRQHAESTHQWQSDVTRREELDHDGWRLVVLLSGDIYRSPARTLKRLCTAMEDCGMPVPVLSEEWRRHFPGYPGAGS